MTQELNKARDVLLLLSGEAHTLLQRQHQWGDVYHGVLTACIRMDAAEARQDQEALLQRKREAEEVLLQCKREAEEVLLQRKREDEEYCLCWREDARLRREEALLQRKREAEEARLQYDDACLRCVREAEEASWRCKADSLRCEADSLRCEAEDASWRCKKDSMRREAEEARLRCKKDSLRRGAELVARGAPRVRPTSSTRVAYIEGLFQRYCSSLSRKESP